MIPGEMNFEEMLLGKAWPIGKWIIACAILINRELLEIFNGILKKLIENSIGDHMIESIHQRKITPIFIKLIAFIIMEKIKIRYCLVIKILSIQDSGCIKILNNLIYQINMPNITSFYGWFQLSLSSLCK